MVCPPLTTAVIMFLIAGSNVMSFVMSFTGLPSAIGNALISVSSNKYVILLIINLVLLVVGWNIQDTTRLWLEGWIASQQGWRIDVLAHSLNQLRPELFEGRTLLVWCGENRTSAQQQQLTSWQEQGHDIFPLGI